MDRPRHVVPATALCLSGGTLAVGSATGVRFYLCGTGKCLAAVPASPGRPVSGIVAQGKTFWAWRGHALAKYGRKGTRMALYDMPDRVLCVSPDGRFAALFHGQVVSVGLAADVPAPYPSALYLCAAHIRGSVFALGSVMHGVDVVAQSPSSAGTTRLARLGGHAGSVFGLAWSAGLLASASDDRSVHVWDLCRTCIAANSSSCGRQGCCCRLAFDGCAVRFNENESLAAEHGDRSSEAAEKNTQPSHAPQAKAFGLRATIHVDGVEHCPQCCDLAKVTGAMQPLVVKAHRARVWRVAFCGATLYTAGEDARVLAHDLNISESMLSASPPRAVVQSPCGAAVWALAVDSESLYASFADGSILCAQPRDIPAPPIGTAADCRALALINGRALAHCGDGTLRWSDTGAVVAAEMSPRAVIAACGRYSAVVGTADGRVLVIRMASGTSRLLHGRDAVRVSAVFVHRRHVLAQYVDGFVVLAALDSRERLSKNNEHVVGISSEGLSGQGANAALVHGDELNMSAHSYTRERDSRGSNPVTCVAAECRFGDGDYATSFAMRQRIAFVGTRRGNVYCLCDGKLRLINKVSDDTVTSLAMVKGSLHASDRGGHITSVCMCPACTRMVVQLDRDDSRSGCEAPMDGSQILKRAATSNCPAVCADSGRPRVVRRAVTPGSVERLVRVGGRLRAAVFEDGRLFLRDARGGLASRMEAGFGGPRRPWELDCAGRLAYIQSGKVSVVEPVQPPCALESGVCTSRLTCAAGLETSKLVDRITNSATEKHNRHTVLAGTEDGCVVSLRQTRHGWAVTGRTRLFDDEAKAVAVLRDAAVVCGANGQVALVTGAAAAVVPGASAPRDFRLVSLAAWETNGGAVCAATGGSDGRVRLWRCTVGVCAPAEVASHSAHGLRCVLSVAGAAFCGMRLVFSGSTDGRVLCASVDMDALDSGIVDACGMASPPAITLLGEYRAHQSGVTALAVAQKGDTLLLLSGGDDGAVCVHVLDARLRVLARHCAVAHGGTVVGVALGQGAQTALSVGADQRVALWDVDALRLAERARRLSPVADPAGVFVCGDAFGVVGCGIETCGTTGGVEI